MTFEWWFKNEKEKQVEIYLAEEKRELILETSQMPFFHEDNGEKTRREKRWLSHWPTVLLSSWHHKPAGTWTTCPPTSTFKTFLHFQFRFPNISQIQRGKLNSLNTKENLGSFPTLLRKKKEGIYNIFTQEGAKTEANVAKWKWTKKVI